MAAFLRRTMLGGAIVVLVFGSIGYFAWQAISGLGTFLARIPKMMSVESSFPALTGLAALAILVTALGLLLQVPPVHRAVERGMAWLGARFPFSRLLHGLELELMGIAKSPVKSVLAKIGDHQVLGFLMEELVDGRCVVFAPGSPNPSKGTVYIVAPESVQRIDASRVQVVSCISNWGAGVGKVVGPP